MNIVITGASKGIGKAIAERFAKGGHTLLLCSRNETELKQLADALQNKFNVTVHYKATDMSAHAAVTIFANWILEKIQQPDIIINNAGSFLPGSVNNEPEGTLEKMMAVNLYSAYHLTRALLPSMMKNKNGHIFNMCSIASLHAYDNGGAYSISKFALAGFTKNLREEMKPHNIKVTGVYPGAVMSDSWAGSNISPERIMEANDVAEMIYTASQLSPQACIEDIVMRPQLGDL
jgi:short-subunit dehydrogenase